MVVKSNVTLFSVSFSGQSLQMFLYELLVKSLPFALRAPGCKIDFVTGGLVAGESRELDSMNSLISYSQIVAPHKSLLFTENLVFIWCCT